MSSIEKNELLPCPYCGSEDAYVNNGDILCPSCPAMMDSCLLSEEELIKAWNTRVK